MVHCRNRFYRFSPPASVMITPSPKGRLAPSPTGKLHLGNAFAFLMAWLDARSRKASLVLRMEDIDPDRSRPEHADDIMRDLHWLGLSWGEGPDIGGDRAPYTQSERLERYAALLEDLEQRNLLYPCFCTRKELRSLASAPHIGDEGAPYPGTCRVLGNSDRRRMEQQGRRACLRLDTDAALKQCAVQRGRMDFDDLVLGPQSFSLQECGGDFALRRSDGVIAYQLAVAADDAAMGISHVIRGEDLLLSTPRQLLLFGLMDTSPPMYAHIPLLHDHKGERLAKRHKSLELEALRAAGVRPQAITGYLGHLAGCMDRPEAAEPAQLLKSFSLALLSGKQLRLPADIQDLLIKI